jgi:hypothetical protein
LILRIPRYDNGRAGRSALLGAILLAGAGCAASAGARQPQTQEDCAGTAVLLVENQVGFAVDILETHRGTNATAMIAQVGPGSHEITIRSEAEYSYRALAPRSTAIQDQRRVTRGSAVRLVRQCRTPSSRPMP